MDIQIIPQALRKFFALLTVLSLLLAGIGVVGPDVKDTDIQNVIFFIGDGMGPNHLEKTKAETGAELAMDTFPLQGFSKTANYVGTTTDSAAGGTALATGIRTINGCIGVYPTDMFAYDSYPMNLTELFMEAGKKTGVVTSDSTAGATPASFSAHTDSRDNTKIITNQQLASGIDLIWGANSGHADAEKVEAAGYKFVDSYEDILALEEGDKSFAQFSNELWRAAGGESYPTLSLLTEAAINFLKNDDNGFFLMVEGAHIDKNSHKQNAEGTKEALLEFDRAVQAALDFAEENGNTLIVISADHETGNIKLKNGVYEFNSGSHSRQNVIVRVYGSEDMIEPGEVMKNREIPVRIARELGFGADVFPRTIKKAAAA